MWGDFVTSALLILLTAGLTGLAIPLITKSVDERRRKQSEAAEETRLRARAEFEATLARQTKVIDAQASLVDRFADVLWKFQLLVLAVPYYQQFPSASARYEHAVDEYLASAGSVLGQIRAEISKSLRLASPEMYDQLIDLYRIRLLAVDLELTELIDAGPRDSPQAWRDFLNQTRDALSVDVDQVIDSLAGSFRLSWSSRKERSRS